MIPIKDTIPRSSYPFVTMALVVVNRWRLPAAVRIPIWRLVILVATAAFFGFFTMWAAYDLVRVILAN